MDRKHQSTEKEVSVRQYYMEILTTHKIVLLYRVKARQVILK